MKHIKHTPEKRKQILAIKYLSFSGNETFKRRIKITILIFKSIILNCKLHCLFKTSLCVDDVGHNIAHREREREIL